MTDEMITRIEGALGRITLNRPQALHALNTQMCRTMLDTLLAWRDDPNVRAVLVDHAPGTRGFCAGGDVRMLADDAEAAKTFFRTEYQLNHAIFTFPKPYIAIQDGVTMGGGVGISVHGWHRVATERTIFAMPEATIGLIADVGGGWFLPRLDDAVGTWLLFTAARLKAADCLAIGLATSFTPSAQVPALTEAIAAAASEGEEAIAAELAAAHADPGPPVELDPQRRALIKQCFSAGEAQAILDALAANGSDWAAAQAAAIAGKSPLTLKVSLEQFKRGAMETSFAAQLAAEYRITARMVAEPDFKEGVRALLIDKDNRPQWPRATLAAVDDALVQSFFAPFPEGEEWRPAD